MNKKPKNGLNMSCPVPPWTPKNIVRLSSYLGVSQARITKMLGISYSALRAWLDGRSKNISTKIVGRLKKFEGKIPPLRAKAEEKYLALIQKEEKKKLKLPKPWAVSRIRSFMHTWGMSQVEFAIFAGVSYDTVTSWSRGRRRLVRRETADQITDAEKLASSRGFPKGASESKKNPWVEARKFMVETKGNKIQKELSKNLCGDYQIQVIEQSPGEFLAAKKAEKIVISAGKKRDTFQIVLNLGWQKLQFSGERRQLGGLKVIDLQTEKDDPAFFNGKAGCITPTKNFLKISLWSAVDLPVRLIAAPI